MSPREQNILSVLNVLQLVWRAHRHMYPNLSIEEQYTIKITQEHVAKAGLTIPVFINTLDELSKKGYLVAINVFEDKYYPEIQRLLEDETYNKIVDALEKTDTSEFIGQAKVAIADAIETTVPANMHIRREEVLREEIGIRDILDLGKTMMQGHISGVVSTVVFSPFRSIERLLKKMNDGTPFDEVKDAGIWYDPQTCEFHFDDITIPTSYNNKPSKAHFALKALFGQFGTSHIEYEDIPEFEWQREEAEEKSYRDALNNFIKKHPRLPEIFTVYANHFVIHEEYLEHIHETSHA